MYVLFLFPTGFGMRPMMPPPMPPGFRGMPPPMHRMRGPPPPPFHGNRPLPPPGIRPPGPPPPAVHYPSQDPQRMGTGKSDS